MKKHRRKRKTSFFFAAISGALFLVLSLNYPNWVPIFSKYLTIKIREVEPMLPAPSVREGAEQVLKSKGNAILQRFSFDKGQDSLKVWEEKIFKGHTVFKVAQENGLCYLSSQSRDACSGLYVKTDLTATPELWINWKWRVKEFPRKKHPELLSNRAEDDFAARLYVIFLASNFFKSDVMEYIWDEKIRTGTVADSPYSERIKLLVIHTGPAGSEGGGWVEEERNIYEDYQKLFGKAPSNPVGLVALMSDSNNTETEASADFAEIILKRKIFKK